MSWYRCVWVCLIWNTLCFLYLNICFLLWVWEVSSHNFLKYIVNPPFLPLLVSLSCVDWQTLYYPVGVLHYFHFFSFGFLSAVLISIFLSSRSLLCSSLFFLLFTAFSPALVSANEFYNFSWFLLIVSSSFLEYFAFLLIAFHSFSILIFFLKLLSRLKEACFIVVLLEECSRSFNCEWFLCFFILLIFILLCEFRINSYLLWS